ncbi:MAG: gliding motility protein [Deltaproteobacteria bacterium]|nr:gliding motility protein [Deltaproteobacteria bacterium]MBW2137313.1 gliding motility protein [Deltaproteobacteria bacterium]
MTFVNLKKREVQIKIVYYGPGRGGKTTNLLYLYEKFRSRIKAEMVAIKTHGDRTLFFDFIPFDVGRINGFEVKVQLYTVPGQIKYNATRRLVLRGVDGVVFVADSLVVRRKNNLLSLKNLQENLSSYGKSIFQVPLVMQYNKRDLEKEGIPILPLQTMEKDLNTKLRVPSFGASAITGENVVQTLKKIILLTLEPLKKEMKKETTNCRNKNMAL